MGSGRGLTPSCDVQPFTGHKMEIAEVDVEEAKAHGATLRDMRLQRRALLAEGAAEADGQVQGLFAEEEAGDSGY